ncbi:MAG: HD domain-containing protein [Bacteroidales bacterium]|jgi:hypothetical protein|nr:HD domain-containing protein [Bacteroidales bacterium]
MFRQEPTIKHKILNDPVHGFISVENELLLTLIDDPFFQRLRRIRQLGLTPLVYPGAQHTRYQHAVGALHLMQLALHTLESRGMPISDDEKLALQVAILLHDIGHGPFSHALERVIIPTDHETITRLIMRHYQRIFGEPISDAIRAFDGECRPFIHELISSQLDMDRLDYLKRDSFYTGVVEGTIGSERIIKMLTLTPDEHLAVEEKGIYTIENFLLTRRMMYWQVYLHKTVVAAENMLRQAIYRARDLTTSGNRPWTTPNFGFFLENAVDAAQLAADESLLHAFCLVDDDDVTASLKAWMTDDDPILSFLSQGLVNRNLFKIETSWSQISEDREHQVIDLVSRQLDIPADLCKYLVIRGSVGNRIYNASSDTINVILRDSKVADISSLSGAIGRGDTPERGVMFYLCYPRQIENL